jgi:hypothetical protein
MKRWFLCQLLISFFYIGVTQSYKDDSFFKYGFKAAANLPLESDYSMIPGKRSMCGEVGFYGRFGGKLSGEIGLDIYFNKRYFSNSSPFLSSMIETRYLQIPIRGRIEFPTKKNQKIHGVAGIIYQQLISISQNNVGYDKRVMTKSPFLLTCGVGYSYQFLSFEINYRHFLLNFDINDTKSKQKQLNFAMYLMF